MDPELPLFMKLAHSSKSGGDHGGRSNPFVPFIEAMSSRNIRLLNKVNGEFRICVGEPSSHPDTILTDAKNVAQEEKILLPRAPTLRSTNEILTDYDLLYNCGKISQMGTFKQMIKLQPPHFAKSCLESLAPIMIPDMMLHKVHKNNYLLCRTISPAVRMVAVQVAVEDPAGNVADLALHNSFDTAGVDHDGIAGILPLGQVILIREPWFKLGTTGGNPTIRVDTPSDLVLLQFNHPKLRGAPESWRQKPNLNADAYRLMGNEAFKKNHLEAAIRAYTTGLTVDPSASSLRLGRSQCYLKLGQLSLALNDARVASEDEALPSLVRLKAQYRTAETLYAMDQYAQAVDILKNEAIAKYSPGDLYTLRKKVQVRLLEQSQGNYDWFALSKLAGEINGKHPIHDVADYIGPIKVAQMNNIGGGRGLVTTRAVMAGELLLVSKPFAFASPLEFPDLLRALKLEGIGIAERAHYEVVGRAARRLMGDHTSASPLFLDLYPGNDYEPLPHAETTTPPPSFLTHGAHHWTISGEYPTVDVDINKVEGIIASNSFSNEIDGYDLGKTEAIYALPSLMNHSCHGTAVRIHIGSIVAVRASRDMKEGEEVTCSYMGIGEHVGSSYLNRAPALKKWFNNCRCSLCRSDREDGDTRCQEREEYNSQLALIRTQRLHPTNTQLSKDLQVLVSNIKSTYRKGRKEPMDTLGLAQRVLAFMSQQNAREAIRQYIDALKSHGIVVKAAPPKRVPRKRSDIQRKSLIIETSSFPSQFDTLYRCIKVMNTITSLEFYHGKPEKASHWAVACLWTHEVFYGPGKEYLWHTLSIDNPSQSPLGQLLEDFE